MVVFLIVIGQMMNWQLKVDMTTSGRYCRVLGLRPNLHPLNQAEDGDPGQAYLGR
jgi:hypothetical protein